jgi:hypothetical protein
VISQSGSLQVGDRISQTASYTQHNCHPTPFPWRLKVQFLSGRSSNPTESNRGPQVVSDHVPPHDFLQSKEPTDAGFPALFLESIFQVKVIKQILTVTS